MEGVERIEQRTDTMTHWVTKIGGGRARVGQGAQRLLFERAFAHLHPFRRLRIRWTVRDDIREAFLTLGCALICWRRLHSFR